MMRIVPVFVVSCLLASSASAQQLAMPSSIDDEAAAAAPAEPGEQPAHPIAVEYSHGYEVRAKIHRTASFAMLPLFATDLALGQSLYDSSTDGKRTAHAAVGSAIGGLFALNTVTGAWNLWESRKDPNHRGRRLAHGLLMLGADAGFFATAAAAPDRNSANGLSNFTGDRNVHRTLALTSIGLATASYLIMLFGGHD